jgi:hypothetical protein
VKPESQAPSIQRRAEESSPARHSQARKWTKSLWNTFSGRIYKNRGVKNIGTWGGVDRDLQTSSVRVPDEADVICYTVHI